MLVSQKLVIPDKTSWNLIIVTTTINSFRAGHTDDFTWNTTKNGIPKN